MAHDGTTHSDPIDQLLAQYGLNKAGAQAGGSIAGAQAGTSTSEPMVFLGERETGTRSTLVGRGDSLIPGAVGQPSVRTLYEDDVVSIDEAKARFWSWSDEELSDWADTLVLGGLIDEDERWDLDKIRSWWDQSVEVAAYRGAGTGEKVHPFDAVELMSGGYLGSAADRARNAGSASGFTGTRNKTVTSINLTDRSTARALVNNVLSKALGRAATAEEMATFTDTLSRFESDNPTVTDIEAQYEDGVEVSQSSTTRGGTTAAGSEQVLLEAAQEDPEYGAVQAATQYFNALEAAIGGIGGPS